MDAWRFRNTRLKSAGQISPKSNWNGRNTKRSRNVSGVSGVIMGNRRGFHAERAKNTQSTQRKKYSLRSFACPLRALRETTPMTENEISYEIIGKALDIHKTLGPGLLESVYETTLSYELRQAGMDVQTQVPMPLVYKEITMEVGYRLDLLVEHKVIVELKAVEQLAPVHYAQTLTYLKLSGLKLALLINFNSKTLKEGIHRLVNNL